MKRTLAALAAASALAAALFGLWSNGAPQRLQAAQAPGQRAAARHQAPTPAAPPLSIETAAPGAVVEAVKFEETRTPIQPQPSSGDDPGPGPYLERYGGRSGRLSPHASLNPDGPPVKNASTQQQPQLLVWTESLRVKAGEPGAVRASLLDRAGKPVAAERIEITRVDRQNAPLGAPTALLARPSGDAAQYGYELGTEHASDGAHATAPTEYRFIVHASGTLEGQAYERKAGGFFYAQDPGAALDAASAKTSLNHGDLELSLDVKAERAGSYFASAELWGGPDGQQPIAFARERLGQLSAGEQHVTLQFGGQVIADSGIDGPYTVRNVQLLQTDAVPPQRATSIPALAPTRAFRAQDFH